MSFNELVYRASGVRFCRRDIYLHLVYLVSHECVVAVPYSRVLIFGAVSCRSVVLSSTFVSSVQAHKVRANDALDCIIPAEAAVTISQALKKFNCTVLQQP